MTASSPIPARDDALAVSLKQAGIDLDAAAAREIARAAVAAPRAFEPDAWIAMIGPRDALPPDLIDRLRALFAALDAEFDDGLSDLGRAKDEMAARLASLRAELRRRGLQAFHVPRADEHQGEYVPRRAQRLAWITGFTGSAGAAIVGLETAAVFTDGRYVLQVQAETDGENFAFRHISDEPPSDWIRQTLKTGEKLGYDPWLHTLSGVAILKQACEAVGATLVAVDGNPLDAVWENQALPPLSPVLIQASDQAGEDSAAKRARIADAIADSRADAAVLSAPDSIAWLLNIRGGDLPRTPFALGYAVLHTDASVDLYMDRRKIAAPVAAHLGDAVRLMEPERLADGLSALGREGKSVLVDPGGAPSWIADRLEAAGADLVKSDDPVALPKARKNEAEIGGARKAHRRDGAALTYFLSWVSAAAPSGRLTELGVSERLAEMRAQGTPVTAAEAAATIRDLSFDAIVGYGPNSAVIHYRVNAKTSLPIEQGSLLLVDSGAQYIDGTTDVTRTIPIGQPTDEHRDRFTRVLKGHIAVAAAVFPKGTTGHQLDALARTALWRAGLDYDHGTGHGVGSYLSVHEGPHRISKAGSKIALEPGMIVSNEPGYYKPDDYGIRIENLVAVIPVEIEGAEREMLGFETLTLAPIDRALIDPDLLTREETDWLDAYHVRVRETIGPLVDPGTAKWLAGMTAPLADGS